MLSLHFRCWGPGKAIEENIHLRAQPRLQGWDFKLVSLKPHKEERRRKRNGTRVGKGIRREEEIQEGKARQPGAAGSLQEHQHHRLCDPHLWVSNWQLHELLNYRVLDSYPPLAHLPHLYTEDPGLNLRGF